MDLSFYDFYDKKHVLGKNRCETGNEAGSHLTPGIERLGQTGAHIPLVSNCGYLEVKKYFLF